jgi:hypothetical protein
MHIQGGAKVGIQYIVYSIYITVYLLLAHPVYYKIESRSHRHCCSGKGIRITYSECISSAFGKKRAKPLACPALPHFFAHYFINGMIFGEKKELLSIKCVFCFSTTVVEIFLILG